MKIVTKFFILSTSLTFMVACSENQSGAGKATANSKTSEFYVRGNCGMCEERIEETVKGIEGVSSADYTVDTKMLKVEFDSTKTSEQELHQAVAKVGHETKSVSMDEKAHEELPECCKKGAEH